MTSERDNSIAVRILGAFGLLLWAAIRPAAGAQVDGLEVFHVAGQSFITFNEVDPPEVAADADDATVRRIVERANRDGRIRYRLYRSREKIKTVRGLTPVGQVRQLSCYNVDYYGIDGKSGRAAVRYVITDGGKALEHGTGLYVHNPRCGDHETRAYYAITVVEDGAENEQIGPGNSLRTPVLETQGRGRPVLQRTVKPDEFAYIKDPELHYYVRWEAPPNSSVENRPIDYLVAIPPEAGEQPSPVGLHLHCWGGSLDGGYGWWYQHGRGNATYLISSNQVPYDWWTGYHELYYTGPRNRQTWSNGVVRPYTTTRMLSFLDWAAGRYGLDLNRVFTAGSSMGGSGAPMFAIRYSDRIAWSIGWVGVHDPGNTPQFQGSYERVYGDKDWRVKFVDGSDAFEYYKDAAYLRRYPARDVGFITWSNGKNDGGIGWPQALEFLQAMQQTRRPHIFVWGLRGHGQRAMMPAGGGERVMPIDIRLDQSLPAFTNCSLDDNPGTASKLAEPKEVQLDNHTQKDTFDGDSSGQVNLYLRWETADIVDTAERWEMTVSLTADAPEPRCLVDITPRRLQKFKVAPGLKVRWRITAPGLDAQSGSVEADRWLLVTLPQVVVGKSQCRVEVVVAE